ncbi:MAG: hypothetical protein Q4B30_07565 [Coriobacteriaceae bacterium]|nr:hypothetical protein [Coriobacteriaceae bacterium]
MQSARAALPPTDRRQGVTVETLKILEPGRLPRFEPVHVRWHDGRRWEVERIYGHEPMADADGSEVVRWRVKISGMPKVIYETGGGWFVVPREKPPRLP